MITVANFFRPFTLQSRPYFFCFLIMKYRAVNFVCQLIIILTGVKMQLSQYAVLFCIL